MIYDGELTLTAGCDYVLKSAIAEMCAPILRRNARFVFLGQSGDGKQTLVRFGNVHLRKKKKAFALRKI